MLLMGLSQNAIAAEVGRSQKTFVNDPEGYGTEK